MRPTAIARSIARLQYAAVRLPCTVLERRVAASHWGGSAVVRLGFEISLGSLDQFAGWLLADEQISRRGQALMRRTGRTEQAATADATATTAPARSARNGRILQALPSVAPVAEERGEEDERPVRSAADLEVTTAAKPAMAEDAQARHTAGEPAGEQPGGATGPAIVRFTLPADVHASTVALCGEFNNWSTQDIWLERAGDGSWQASVALEPGRSYRYRYLLDGERWENAWDADRYVPNPYGGTDSVVVVE